MNKFRTVLIALFAVLLISGTAIATASHVGSGAPFSFGTMTVMPVECNWTSTADTECAVYLPSQMGAPDGILTYYIYDLDTSGKAKTAIGNGEGVYAITRGTGEEYCDYAADEYAGSTAGAVTVYRGDLDGGDTTPLQQSVVTEIWFYWNSYGDITW